MNINRSQSNEPFFEMRVSTVEERAVDARPISRGRFDSMDFDAGHKEGQLAVDVLDMGSEIMVLSTMAGALTSSIDVYIHNDLLTIRGTRPFPIELVEDEVCVHQECFWGPFSRTVVLPVEVRGEFARAEYKNGILMVTVPKQQPRTAIPVIVVDE